MQDNNNSHTDEHKGHFPAPIIGWYSTLLLATLYWLSILDRTIISLLVDPIKSDLQISDVQFGMLHGLAFAVTFSLFGLLAGSLADRYSRRLIVFASVTIWSLSTALCGMAASFWHLLLARVGVGAGEAGLNPSATSILTDLFPPSKLTMALAVYSLGASAGAGCAYLFGGILIDLVSGADAIFLPLVGELRPWQAVFLIIGIPGIFIAFLSFTMPEPRRQGVRKARKAEPILAGIMHSYVDLFAFMKQHKKFFICHYAGFGIASMSFAGNQAWYAAHIGRNFGWGATEIGITLGLTLVIGGMLGKFFCGFGVEALCKRGHDDAQFKWFAACLLLALPAGVIAMTSDNPVLFVGGLGLFVFLLSPLAAIYVSALNLVTPNELRGTGVAFFATTVGLIAMSCGPILIAAFSEYIFGGDAIGHGMAMLMACCLPLAAIILFAGRRAMSAAVMEAREWRGQD